MFGTKKHTVNIWFNYGKPMFGTMFRTLQSNKGWSILAISEMSLDEKPRN